MKYSFKNGTLVCRETGEAVAEIHGVLSGVRVVESENGLEFLQVDLKNPTAEEGRDPVATLVMKKYGDSSLKVLRCLYGIVDFISCVVIGVSIAPREGRSGLITVTADGEVLSPIGHVGPYAFERKTLTDKMIVSLKRAARYSREVMVVGFPGDEGRGIEPEAIPDLIRDLKASGRTDFSVVKRGFTDEKSANGYLRAVEDIRPYGNVIVLSGGRDDELMAEVWAAWNEPVPSTEHEADTADDDPEEEF